MKNKWNESIGPLRIYEGETRIPGLAISRSLGDIIAHEVGVINEPYITRITTP